MSGHMDEALQLMRENAALQSVFTELEAAGWTILGIRGNEIACSHPQLDQSVSLVRAQQIMRAMQ
jgi:hypothetical protein